MSRSIRNTSESLPDRLLRRPRVACQFPRRLMWRGPARGRRFPLMRQPRSNRTPTHLAEHLESGCPLDEFLENFPSVSRDMAVAVLMGAQELTLERAGG